MEWLFDTYADLIVGAYLYDSGEVDGWMCHDGFLDLLRRKESDSRSVSVATMANPANMAPATK